jgi:hypothetical protein
MSRLELAALLAVLGIAILSFAFPPKEGLTGTPSVGITWPGQEVP